MALTLTPFCTRTVFFLLRLSLVPRRTSRAWRSTGAFTPRRLRIRLPSGARIAGELHWFEPWNKVLKWERPGRSGLAAGKLIIPYNCLDRHAASSRRDKIAFFWEGEPGDTRSLTYGQLLAEVERFANALKGLGVAKGDRVALYMGMVPELAVAMLACARIGAVHSVIFGGFSANAIVDRVNDQQSTVVVTQDASWRRGTQVPLKSTVDEAVAHCPSVKSVVVFRRTGAEVEMRPGRDHWWHELVAKAAAHCSAEPLDSEDPLYILYTSGSTGKPKGIVHTTGGYSVGTYITTKWIFDLKDEDVYWCTADIGWVTGHSYIVYGPLQNGATTLMYEGAPNHPDFDRFWALVEKYKVSVFYTAPTAIRAFIKWGDEYPNRHDLSSLRLLAQSANRSIRRPGCGIARSSARSAVRLWTPGGRPRPAAS